MIPIEQTDTLQRIFQNIIDSGSPVAMQTFFFGFENSDVEYPCTVVIAHGPYSELIEQAVKVVGEQLVAAGLANAVESTQDPETGEITPQKGN